MWAHVPLSVKAVLVFKYCIGRQDYYGIERSDESVSSIYKLSDIYIYPSQVVGACLVDF